MSNLEEIQPLSARNVTLTVQVTQRQGIASVLLFFCFYFFFLCFCFEIFTNCTYIA